MSKNKPLLSLIVLLTLTLTYFFLKSSWLSKFSTKERLALPLFNPEKIEGLAINYNSRETVLEKRGEQFFIAGGDDPADATLVGEMLTNLSQLTISEEVSRNQDNWSLFELDEKAIHLKLKKAEGEAEIWLGKSSSDFPGLYFRLGSDVKTYLSTQNIRAPFLNEDLRDKTIVRINPEDVTAFTANQSGRPQRFMKEGDRWKMEGAQMNPETTQVNDLLNQFNPFRADNLLKSETNINFQNPRLEMKFETKSGEKTVKISIQKIDGHHPVMTDTGSGIFLITTSRLDELLQKLRLAAPAN